jgi:putative hydrolase of HD superfamily
MNIEKLTYFLQLSGKLKYTKRTGWVEAEVPEPESVADHVFRVALLSMILSDDKGLDTLKAVTMALIHDLPEALIGDLPPRQKETDHILQESQTMNQMLELLPEKLSINYRVLWDEYIEGKSPEAKLVHTVDKLEMLLQAAEYKINENQNRRLEHFWQTKIDTEYEAYKDSFKELKNKV